MYLCIMRFIELEARTYIGREYKDYLKSQEDIDEEGNEWKRNIDVPVPKAHPSRVLVAPDDIVMAIETCSMEALAKDSENPEFDSVDICLMDGVQLNLVGTLDDLYEKLEEFYERNRA